MSLARLDGGIASGEYLQFTGRPKRPDAYSERAIHGVAKIWGSRAGITRPTPVAG